MKPNFGQRMAVKKYFDKIQELTNVETQVYTPKRGEKTEAFAYTGQTGYRKFTKAIVRKISPAQKLTFKVDKTRPRGSRFVVTDKTTGRIFLNIPARLFEPDYYEPEFYDWVAELFGFGETDDAVDYIQTIPPDDANELYSEYILETYAGDAEFFLINAGESYIWGAGGDRKSIARKIRKYKEQYSATNFDVNDKNSHYYGNWLRGVTGFGSRFDVLDRIGEAQAKRRAFRDKFKMESGVNYRRLKNGLIGEFRNGQLVRSFSIDQGR
jgi:hypothetical protein